MVEKTLTFQNGQLFYRVTGEGPSVVLLHGIPADGELWRNQFAKIGPFQFIIPDLPGSGSSSLIEDMSMEGMAEAIKAILDEEKISSAVIIGHSMGGYISLAFAEKYPERLRGFGLFHSTAYPDTDEKKETRRKAIGLIEDNGAFEFLRTSVPNLFSASFRDKNRVAIDQLIARANNFSVRALVSYYLAMIHRPNRAILLTRLKVPVLFIAGKDDNAVGLKDSLELCHLPEISYFHVLAESGHMGMIEEPEKTNSALNDYLIHLS